MGYRRIKRGLDIFFSVILLILLFPLLIIISVLILIDSKGNVVFKQKRVGKDKKYFYLIKFRTMKSNTPKDVPTHLLNDPQKYITKVGRFLRKTSLDELPQLVNILKGEMSFIGPRPALWNQFDLIEERDKYYVNSLLPGLTGWAQINGRDELTIEEKAKYDGEYYKNFSFYFDLKILVISIIKVIKGSGVVEGKKSK